MSKTKSNGIIWEPKKRIRVDFSGQYHVIGIDPGHEKMGISCGTALAEMPPMTISLTSLREWFQSYTPAWGRVQEGAHQNANTMPLLLAIEWFTKSAIFKQAKSAASEAIRCVKDVWCGPVIVGKVYPQTWHKMLYGTAKLEAVRTYSGGATWKELAVGVCCSGEGLNLETDAAEAHLIRHAVIVEFNQRLLREGLI